MPDVLIVDDDLYACSELRSLLESSPFGPFSIMECHSGEQGIRALRRHCPTFLLFDPSLPDSRGNQFQRQVLGTAPGISAIIVTQLKMFDLVYEAINCGLKGYLLKPVLPFELLSLMERLIHVRVSPWSTKSPKRHEESLATTRTSSIQIVVEYVKDHYQEPLNIADAARQVYLSPSHFSHLFKKETGVTFIEFVTAVRLDQAKKLLRTTNVPVEVIAQQTGFGTGSYFATTFRRLQGQSPRSYRQNFSRLYQHKIAKY